MRPQQTKRHAHYVKHNDRSETLHNCIWYDCETRPEIDDQGVTKHILVFGWAAYRRRTQRGTWTEPEWMRFTTGEELWNWINSKARPKKTLYVWAHNHFFDWSASSGRSLLNHLGWTLQSAIADSPPFILKYSRLSSKLILTDTLNIWRMSLEQMGKMIGLSKLSMPSVWNGNEEDDTYCRRDVEIIIKAVCDWADFLHREDMGKMCLTVASQAMQTFRHKYLDESILIDADQDALRIARASYHGGRVECGYIGRLEGPLYLLDINSLYPYCMATYEFPVRLVGVWVQPSRVEIADILERYLCSARVTVETALPMVPRVEKGKLTFPTGRFEAHITTPEMVYLLEHKQMLDVREVAVYEKARPFVHFVQDLYQRRMNASTDGNKMEAGHYKLLLNSFSGKWGQNGIKWQTIDRDYNAPDAFWPVVDADDDTVTSYRCFDGLIQRKEVFAESRESHPALAAHITAYGRMVLWALIRKIPPKHYFYCDTDSILISEEGLKHVEQPISDVILGALKIVGKFSNGVIYGCKDYVLDGVRTCKGIRNQAIELSPGNYAQEKWVGFRTALRKGWLDGPRTLRITKRLRRIYTKGVVHDDGFVLPLHIP